MALKNFLKNLWYTVAGVFTDHYRRYRWEGVISKGFERAFEAGKMPRWVEAPDVYLSDFGIFQVIPNRFIEAPRTFWQSDDNRSIHAVPPIFAVDYPVGYDSGVWGRAWDRGLCGWVYYRR